MTAYVEVSYRGLDGALHRIQLADRGEFHSPGSALHQRLVTGPQEVPFLRKSVPAEAGRRDPRLYALLDNEIRVVTHLTRVLGGRGGEVPSLVGYNMDADEPFVLLRPYAGQPATELIRTLDDDGKRQFQIGFLSVLHLIGEVGVVHGAVGPHTLRWTGAAVQLVDYERAQMTGEPRHACPGPRQSPERRYGAGLADPRDDVFSAGVLIRELVLGPHALAAPTDQSADPERLKQRLTEVFLPVDQRPTAAELLRRMRVVAPAVRPADPRTDLADGYRRFEEACRRKGGPTTGARHNNAPPDDRRGWRRLLGAR